MAVERVRRLRKLIGGIKSCIIGHRAGDEIQPMRVAVHRDQKRRKVLDSSHKPGRQALQDRRAIACNLHALALKLLLVQADTVGKRGQQCVRQILSVRTASDERQANKGVAALPGRGPPIQVHRHASLIVGQCHFVKSDGYKIGVANLLAHSVAQHLVNGICKLRRGIDAPILGLIKGMLDRAMELCPLLEADKGPAAAGKMKRLHHVQQQLCVFFASGLREHAPEIRRCRPARFCAQTREGQWRAVASRCSRAISTH